MRQPRRSCAISWTRSSGVAVGLECGREERSTRPTAPSTRKRPTHLRAVRSLTSAAAAASVSDHCWSTTLPTSSSRFFRLRAALRWSFIRCPPWGLVASTPPSLQGGPDEQPPQALHLGRDDGGGPSGLPTGVALARTNP